jgi:hypothetical protein
VSELILLALVSTVVILFALVSTVAGAVTAALSTFTAEESVVVVESVFESLQAANIDATAKAKNNFFIFVFLIN